MSSGVLLRRFLAAALAVVPLAAASLPALAADSQIEALRDEWLSNRSATSAATSDLEALDLATAEAAAEYEEVEARLEDATRRLARLRAELRDAVLRQAEAETENEVAIRRLGQATMVMVTMADALAAHAADLDVEIVAAYKYAGSAARFRGVVDVLISSGSLTEFTTVYEQLQTGTENQAELVELVTLLAEQLEDQQALVGALQRETAKAERRAIAERDHVAQLTRDQAELVTEVKADRRTRKRLLAELEEQAAAVSARLDELAAQSDSLLAELSQYHYVGGAPGSKDLLWPTDGQAISGFGYRNHPIFKERRLHAGIDIPGPTGQAVYAARDGVALTVGTRGGYGNVIVLDHGDGMSTVYAHLSAFDVSPGQTVLAGQDIGDVGSTGNSTGPHLHFEIRISGSPTDPLAWF